MNIKQIGHLAFICQDIERSIAFYRDMLGFKHKFTIYYGDLLDQQLAEAASAGVEPDAKMAAELTPIRDRMWIAYFEVGEGVFVELFDAGHATLPSIPDQKHFNYDHVALVVEDIFTAHEQLKQKGVPIDSAPTLGLEHTYQMWSHDPDGNRLEFMQYTDKSWQLVGRE